jgi:hypothetical protein
VETSELVASTPSLPPLAAAPRRAMWPYALVGVIVVAVLVGAVVLTSSFVRSRTLADSAATHHTDLTLAAFQGLELASGAQAGLAPEKRDLTALVGAAAIGNSDQLGVDPWTPVRVTTTVHVSTTEALITSVRVESDGYVSTVYSKWAGAGNSDACGESTMGPGSNVNCLELLTEGLAK